MELRIIDEHTLFALLLSKAQYQKQKLTAGLIANTMEQSITADAHHEPWAFNVRNFIYQFV